MKKISCLAISLALAFPAIAQTAGSAGTSAGTNTMGPNTTGINNTGVNSGLPTTGTGMTTDTRRDSGSGMTNDTAAGNNPNANVTGSTVNRNAPARIGNSVPSTTGNSASGTATNSGNYGPNTRGEGFTSDTTVDSPASSANRGTANTTTVDRANQQSNSKKKRQNRR